MTETPVAAVASAHGIPVIKSNDVNQEVLEQIKSVGIELAVVVAFGVLLKSEAIEALSKGWFNLHFSILPKYRGAAPVQRALMAGETESGITLFKIDEGLDTGPVSSVLPVMISPDETADDLLTRMSLLGATLIAESLPMLHSGIAKLNEQTGNATLAAKLSRADGQLSFQVSNLEVYSRYRAVSSEPGAWATIDGVAVKLLSMRYSNEDLGLEPGELAVKDAKVLVQCEPGMLELVQVQPAGKSAMAADDWYRGLREIRKFDRS
jgi:methionyl-tRNA formyltransferase